MSTWSKSALKLPSVVVTDKSFPTLSASGGPPSKKPTLSFAQKVKEKADADAAADAAAAAAKQVELNRAEARRLTECAEKRQVSLVNTFYKPRTSDEDYTREDSSPDEMDYETALEYEEHMRYNRRERLRVADYSKDLSSEDDERLDEYEDAV